METIPDNTAHISNAEDCVICLAPISERAIAVPCNHSCFDFICLASWTNEQPKCPLCKVDITAIEYDWRSPDDFKTFYLRNVSSRPKTSNHGPEASRRPRRRGAGDFDYLNEVDMAILRRRNVYRYQRYSLHIGSNPVSGFRNVSPGMIASSDKLQRKAKIWMRRELRVFNHLKSTSSFPGSGANLRQTESLMEYILEILKVTDIKGGRSEELLVEHLGENTALFLHELASWLRSPYDTLENWDSVVQYKAKRIQ